MALVLTACDQTGQGALQECRTPQIVGHFERQQTDNQFRYSGHTGQAQGRQQGFGKSMNAYHAHTRIALGKRGQTWRRIARIVEIAQIIILDQQTSAALRSLHHPPPGCRRPTATGRIGIGRTAIEGSNPPRFGEYGQRRFFRPVVSCRERNQCRPGTGKRQTRAGIARVFHGHDRPRRQCTPEQAERLLRAGSD